MKRTIVARLLAVTLTLSALSAGCGMTSASDTASLKTQEATVEGNQTESTQAEDIGDSQAEDTIISQADGTANAQADGTANAQAGGTANAQADGTANAQAGGQAAPQSNNEAPSQAKDQSAAQDSSQAASQADTAENEGLTLTTAAASAADLFTDRDLAQTADTAEAATITLTDEQDVSITQAGVYILKGTAAECTVTVDVDKEDKVQLVLDGVSITNTSAPAIYVVSADKVFITTTDSANTLSTTGAFTADGETNTDAVIFSKDDLVLNGKGTLTISSTDNGISAKDDLKITGGRYVITAAADAIEANDSIAICDGDFTIVSQKDGLHCENDEDTTLGSIYISGGSFTIDAAKDGIQATTTLTIDGGSFDITGSEGLEATYVLINDGTISINASDDGINASSKAASLEVVIEINGGDITIVMGAGDTDALDANGNLYINGGKINITANSPFDYDRIGELNGGTVIVNGEEVTEMTNSMMGPGGMGGQFGGPGGMGGGQFGGHGGGPRGGFGKTKSGEAGSNSFDGPSGSTPGTSSAQSDQDAQGQSI